MQFNDDPLDLDDDLGSTSVQEILQQVGQDSVHLIRLEIELLKRQAVESFDATRGALALASIAALLAVGAFAVLISLVVVVLDVWLPLWTALLVVLVVLAAAVWILQARAGRIIQAQMQSWGSDVE